jgi:transcription termination factor NusB
MELLVPIIVAVIGGPLVVAIQNLRKENTEQHAEARELLKVVASKVDKVDDKLDSHISWHLTKTRKTKINKEK